MKHFALFAAGVIIGSAIRKIQEHRHKLELAIRKDLLMRMPKPTKATRKARGISLERLDGDFTE